MDQAHYESWLAKQAAMGRTVPVTTAPYYHTAQAQTYVKAVTPVLESVNKMRECD